MSRTTTREIIQVCTELAKLDRHGKLEILNYLETELAKPVVERRILRAATGEEIVEGTGAKVPVTYTEGGEK